MSDNEIPKGWAICEYRCPAFRCTGCGKLAVSGWKKIPNEGYCCDECGPCPGKPVKAPKVTEAAPHSVHRSGNQPKRRGRPAGSKNRPKEGR